MPPAVNTPMTASSGSPGFDVGVELCNRVPVLAVKGDLDLATAPALKRHLMRLLAGGHTRVIVDLSEVSFIDSTAIGVLVAAARRLPPGQLGLVGRSERVRSVFAMCGLAHRFPLYASAAEALGEMDDHLSIGTE